MATGKGKEDEDENLGGVLSRLTDLIEGVAVVESGPMVERRQAYIIVRHEKFGPAKKGGGKMSKVSADAAKHSGKSAADDPHGHAHESLLSEDGSKESHLNMQVQMRDQNMNKNKTAWSVLDSNSSIDDFRKLFDIDIEKEEPQLNSSDRQTSVEPGRAPPFKNSENNQAPSFGIFMGSKPSSPGQGVPPGMRSNDEVNRYASSGNKVSRGAGVGQNFHGTRSDRGRGPEGDKAGRSGFGIFSRERTHGTQNRTFKQD